MTTPDNPKLPPAELHSVLETPARDFEDAMMRTIKECRQRAQDCLRLATTATDFFAQDALVRRAADCETMAKTLKPQRTNKHNRHGTRLHEQPQNNVRSM